MRRLLTFSCQGQALGSTLDQAPGRTGLLMVTGGTQTRIGSHRMFERLAAAVAEAGHPCFRFDRRGVGDSEGEDPGFRGSVTDMGAAAAAFRRECPDLERIVGFGLCDGATAIALCGDEAGLSGLILANPWLVEAEADAPPPAYIRRHYRDRLLSPAAWRRALTGGISYRKALAGLRKAAAPSPSSLADDVSAALDRSRLPVRLILARGDATAVAAEVEWRKMHRREAPCYIESNSHTFARAGDDQALLAAVLSALAEVGEASR